MPAFGHRSLGCLAELDPRLQAIATEAITRLDFSIIMGHRSDADQQAAFAAGKSLLPPGKSQHNKTPSLALDFVPSPFVDADWKDTAKFREIARVLCAVAAENGVAVRWGGTWSNNVDDPLSQHLCDADHFEIHGV